jgi:hypothetical protein
MKKRLSPLSIVGAFLFVILLMLGLAVQQGQDETGWTPRARYDDATPLGGKGLRLLLDEVGYATRVETNAIRTMPSFSARGGSGAQVWLLLDPATRFSRREASALLKWVEAGGTLVWADAASPDRSGIDSKASNSPALAWMRQQLGLSERYASQFRPRPGLPLPPLVPLGPGAASIYRTGLNAAPQASGDTLNSSRPHVVLAGTAAGAQALSVERGRGRVIVLPDALSWTNYALAVPATSIWVTNIIRAHAPRGSGIVWDERQHDEAAARTVTPNVLYYLWRPPLRWAVLQVLGALLLLGLISTRRFGRAVALPGPPVVTRASQWALAMASLFSKADRPHVAAATAGETFRRAVARRVGLSSAESDAVLAQRVSQVCDVPYAEIDELLLRSRTPSSHPTQMLRDVQRMEILLQNINARR